MPNDPLLQVRHLVATLGFELVDLQRRGTALHPVLQLRIDRPDSSPGRGVTADECVRAARALAQAWGAAAALGEIIPAFEVSSPGIERPLRFPEHWRRFVGRQVRVRSRALPGKPVTTIRDVPDDAHVTLALPDGTTRTLAFDEIHEAVLVIDWARYGKSTE